MTIITTTMTLHNFMWKTGTEEFDQLFSNPDRLPPEDPEVVILEDDTGAMSTSVDSEMDAVRDSIYAMHVSSDFLCYYIGMYIFLCSIPICSMYVLNFYE